MVDVARLIGPDPSYRLVYSTITGAATADGATGRIWTDQAQTTAANLLDLSGNAIPVVSGAAQVDIDTDSQWPRFQFPDGLVTTVYGSVNGGTATPLVADIESRILTTASLDARYPRVYVATDPAFGYTSGSDIAASAQAAVNAMPSTGGTLLIPAGSWTLSTPLILKTGVQIAGLGRLTSRLTGTAGVFRWIATVHDIGVRDLYLQSNNGHLMAPSGGAANWAIYTAIIRDCTLYVADPNASIFYHVSALDYDNVTVADCDLTRASNATVPGWYVVNSGGAANANRWQRLWARSGNATSTPFFWLESTVTDNYAYDNRFEDITGEQNAGGLIHAFGTYGLIVDNARDHDASVNYAKDIIRVGKSTAPGALKSYFARINNSGRRGGTLGAGVYDINLVPGEVQRCTMHSPNFSNINGGLALNFTAVDRVTVLNAPASSWASQGNAAHLFGGQVQLAAGMLIGNAQDTSGTGTPEGVVVGSVGDVFRRTDGGAGSTFYVKETGSGNTGWVAK